MKTKLYLDTEFTGLHQKTTLISLAIVSECGKEFYAEFTDYDKSQVNEWIRNNVLENLLYKKMREERGFRPDIFYIHSDYPSQNLHVSGDIHTIAPYLVQWLSQFEQAEIISDVHAYDWVLFCELFGGAMGIPKNIYYIPFCFASILRSKGLDPDLNRLQLSGLQDIAQHNALSDAKVLKKCAEILQIK